MVATRAAVTTLRPEAVADLIFDLSLPLIYDGRGIGALLTNVRIFSPYKVC